MTSPLALSRSRVRPVVVAAALLLAPFVAGCLEKPKTEDLWTRVDMQGTNLGLNQVLTTGAVDSVNVDASITYRSIVTGYAVAELRASGTVTAADVVVGPSAPRVPMAYDIDRILANSVSVGRDAEAVTGWDHLIQRMHFRFAAAAPASLDTTVSPTGGVTGLFLVVYLGSGVKIERNDGTDTVIVTPYNSAQYQILPVGLELGMPAP